MKRILAIALCVAVLGSLAVLGPAKSQPPVPLFAPPVPLGWKNIVRMRAAEYGHRNWIVVADSAYPAQSRGGIETVLTNADHLDVTEFVLDELSKQKHVRPVVYTDAELPHVSAKDAATGNEQRIAITASSGLDQGEIDRMIREAQEHLDEDSRKREKK